MSKPEIGVAGTGFHKVASLRPLFNIHNLDTRWLKIEGDIPEEEHTNPARVLGSKLENNSENLADHLRFFAEFGNVPAAIAVFDVLGLRMLPNEGGKASFGSARKILKKPDDGDAVSAVNAHFSEQLKDGTNDEWHWDAYAIGGAVAPINKLGIVNLEKGVSMWDDPFWFGYSHAFVKAFASEDTLVRMIKDETINDRVVSAKSIVGLRAQFLPYDMHKVARVIPGAKMRIIYQKQDVVIDGFTSMTKLVPFLSFVESAMANATPGLAGQIAKEVHSWVN